MLERLLPAAAPAATDEARVAEALEAERLRQARVWGWVRLVGVAVIAVWVVIENPPAGIRFYLPFLAWFAFAGVVAWKLRERGWRWVPYALAVLDAAVLTVVITVPNPALEGAFPMQSRLRIGNELFYYILIGASVFAYAPRLIVFTGAVCAACWLGVHLYAQTLPGTVAPFSGADAWYDVPVEDRLAFFFQPLYVPWTFSAREGFAMIVVSAVLAVFVRQAIGLVFAQSEAARQRANLARHFAPSMVDRLASMDRPFETGRRQDVAVLFADIVGFTRLAETMDEARTLALLRDFHRVVADTVFAHGGTLDKYLGDGVMATFGTPEPAPDDALRAAECARALIAEVDRWSTGREAAGAAPVRVSVGAHFGAVVTGSVGSEARLEYAVLGDVVNVASRLEGLTRELGCRVVLSDPLAAAARTADPGRAAHCLAGFRGHRAQHMRGRGGAVDLWLG